MARRLALVALGLVMAGRTAAQGGECKDPSECDSHGTCDGYAPPAKGTCSCSVGYSGGHCENDPCHGQDCGHGKCSISGSTHICSCDDGYTGPACGSKVSCGPSPSPAHSTGCSGDKVFGDKCTATCDDGWTAGSLSAEFECKNNGKSKYSGSLTCG